MVLQDEAEATLLVGELKGQAAVAVDALASGRLELVGIGGAVGVLVAIAALVIDIASLRIAGCGLLTDLSAEGRVAITASAVFLLSRAGSGRIRRGGQVAGLGHRVTAGAGSGIVDHAVGTEEGLMPSLRAEEPGLLDEGDGLGQE